MKRKKKPAHQIGDGPIQPEYHDFMNQLAAGIDRVLNGDLTGGERRTGFVLMVFPFGSEDGRCNYISNGARVDIRVLLREQLARWEGQRLDEGRA